MLLKLGIALTVAAAFVFLLLLLMWWGQERIVFQPARPPFPHDRAARRIDFQGEDGQPLFAYLVSGNGDLTGTAQGERPARVVIAFHGNADLAVALLPWARELSARAGVAVVLPEYRGYAGLPGPPTIEGARRDARAAARLVRDSLGVPPGATVLYGHSLGSAVAVELAADLAAEDGPGGLVLESPFTSARHMARLIVARPVELVWGLISRVHYDTEALVRTLDVPVWVAHGTRDRVVPVRMGQAVHAAARNRGELLIVDSAGHNDVALIGGERYWDWMVRAMGR
ncbi:MAG: alpha/beta hydrolase [Gemmatimonadaceae bacterium]